jgi:hypothetical protein
VRKTLVSTMFALALGCTGNGDGSDPTALSTNDPDDQSECPVVCSPYDPTFCEPTCPVPPPDAPLPEDPYSTPSSPDAGAPVDPYALGPTVPTLPGHTAC